MQITVSPECILTGELPPAAWWQIVSRHAHTGDVRADMAAAKELLEVNVGYEGRLLEGGSPWPEHLYMTKRTGLVPPPISREEAIAICGAYLRAEGVQPRSGYFLYELHWDLLAAHYCPLRERHKSLKALVDEGILKESRGERRAKESNGIPWPLCFTEKILQEIAVLDWHYKWPKILRFERYIQSVQQAFPLVINMGSVFIGGAVLSRFIPYLVSLFFQDN